METIKLTGISHDGKLTVCVPKEYDEKELEIMIVSSKDIEKKKTAIEEKKIKIKKFLSLIGTAKYPDFPMTKYDVYDQ
jgi:hypothetical protein